MNRDEICRWFRRFRYDPEFHGSVPYTQICLYAGVPRRNLHYILRGELGLTENYRVRLEAAIRDIEAGLRWHKRDRHWEMNHPERFQALPRFERPKHREYRREQGRKAALPAGHR
jgi:hypothetical protein